MTVSRGPVQVGGSFGGIHGTKEQMVANLLELVLLCRLVFARFGGLSVQLLCCELDLEKNMISGLFFS